MTYRSPPGRDDYERAMAYATRRLEKAIKCAEAGAEAEAEFFLDAAIHCEQEALFWAGKGPRPDPIPAWLRGS